MASGLAVPRAASGALSPGRMAGAASPTRAVGAMSPARVPNLPVIEHPMAKLGDKTDLEVRGSSSMGVRRENTVGVVQHGKADHGIKGHPYNQLEGQSLLIKKNSPDRILNWPPGKNYKRLYRKRHSQIMKTQVACAMHSLVRRFTSRIKSP